MKRNTMPEALDLDTLDLVTGGTAQTTVIVVAVPQSKPISSNFFGVAGIEYHAPAAPVHATEVHESAPAPAPAPAPVSLESAPAPMLHADAVLDTSNHEELSSNEHQGFAPSPAQYTMTSGDLVANDDAALATDDQAGGHVFSCGTDTGIPNGVDELVHDGAEAAHDAVDQIGGLVSDWMDDHGAGDHQGDHTGNGDGSGHGDGHGHDQVQVQDSTQDVGMLHADAVLDQHQPYLQATAVLSNTNAHHDELSSNAHQANDHKASVMASTHQR